MQIFDQAWQQLECEGKCDALGGAEYRRVKAEWVRFGMQNAAYLFIAILANLPPLPPPGDPPRGQKD